MARSRPRLLIAGLALALSSSFVACSPSRHTQVTPTTAAITSTTAAPVDSSTGVTSTAATTSTTAATSTTTSTIPSSPTTTPLYPGVVLPDPTYTPGATNPAVTQATIGQTICVAGYTATIRPPSSYTAHIKQLEVAGGGSVSYQGVTYPVHGFHLADANLSHYELDHLVSLEVGGSPADPRNLWMQPYEPPIGTGAVGRNSQTKDKVENATRSAVCAGRLTLTAAQQGLETNWYALGVQLGVVH